MTSQSHYSLTWDTHVKNVCDGLSNLQQNGEFVDMTLAADGHMVKVHQVVMALASPYFKDLIISAQCPHPVIFLSKVKHVTLSAILEYIYTGEVLIAVEHISELMEAAKELYIKGLKDMKIQSTTTETSEQLAKPGEEILQGEDLCLFELTEEIESDLKKSEQSQEDNMIQFALEAGYDSEELTHQALEQDMDKRQDLLSNENQDLLSNHQDLFTEQDQVLLIEQDQDLLIQQDQDLLTEQDQDLFLSQNPNLLLEQDHNLHLEQDANLILEQDENLILEQDQNLFLEQDQNLLLDQVDNLLLEQDQNLLNENIPTVTSDEVHHYNQEDEEMLDSESNLPLKTSTKNFSEENSEVQYTVSKRGSLQMILNRFVYYLKYTNRDRSRQWRCVDYLNHDDKCPAIVVTNDDVVMYSIAEHTHPFHDQKILKKIQNGKVFSAYLEARKEVNLKKKSH